MEHLIISEIMHQGDRGAIVPIECIADLHKDIENLRDSNYFTQTTGNIIRDFYHFDLPMVEFPIRSVIIVASPTPIVRIHFNWRNQRIPVLKPPITKGIADRISDYLNTLLHPAGFHAVHTYGLPLKMLSVRAGLSEYGRNNITYVQDLGSLINLEFFYTDLPCTEYIWRELARMKFCDTCNACIANCPTNAIQVDRPVIEVEKCLTYLNEFIDLCDFPGWLEPSSHNCIHGCLKCQISCPKNHEVVKHIMEAVEFTERETKILLEGATLDRLAEPLKSKLEQIDLMDYLHLLPRNLRVLLDQV